MMTLRKTRTGKNTNDYEMWDGSHVVKMTHDKEYGKVNASAWVNGGDTICRSRTFKTLVGAQKWAQGWLEGMR